MYLACGGRFGRWTTRKNLLTFAEPERGRVNPAAHRAILSLAVLLSAVFSNGNWAASARAQGDTSPHRNTEPTGAFDAVLDNDATHDTDRFYSNGFQLAVGQRMSSDYWLVLRGVHEIYTPEEFRSAEPRPGDRPYAGFLYGRLELHFPVGASFHRLALTLGVVGPSAGAHTIQVWSHRIMDEPRPRGWGTQLSDRLAAALSWEGDVFDQAVGPSGLHFSVHGIGRAEAGTLRVRARTGAGFLVGAGVEAADGASLLSESLGFVRHRRGFGVGLAVGTAVQLVGEDYLLEGREGVSLVPIVGELRIGLALTYNALRLRYVHVLSTSEFRSQIAIHGYGSFRFSTSF